jgi:serine/threonine protein kinase
MATLICGSCSRRFTTNKPPTPGKEHRCPVCQGLLAEAPGEAPPAASIPVATEPVAPSAPVPGPPPVPPAAPPAVAPPPPAAPPAVAGPQPIVPEVRPFGKYRIVRVLGRGGMGVVYEAWDPEHNRKVALKTLLARPSEVRKDEERFSREIRLGTTLPPHPNIVSLYDAGVVEGKRFLAMEYIEGTSFDAWREAHPGSLRGQVEILRDVARAVQHAHAHGIMHRDLKPQNILVDAAGRPHVTDFGLAKTVKDEAAIELTAAGMAVGSPTYMSPEQARGLKSVDGRTDLWSIGVMLYEVLAGRPPFRGKSPIQVLQQAVREPAVPPSRIAKEEKLPPPDAFLEAVCLKALSKLPEDRHASGGALADELDRWLSGKAVAVPAEAGATAAEPGTAPVWKGWWRRVVRFFSRRESGG